jgi:hypothetical protein
MIEILAGFDDEPNSSSILTVDLDFSKIWNTANKNSLWFKITASDSGSLDSLIYCSGPNGLNLGTLMIANNASNCARDRRWPRVRRDLYNIHSTPQWRG